MSRKKFYYTEAERLYVEEQMTVEEIASRFNVSVRTLKTWKKENHWSEKRQEFLDFKQMYLEDFDIFVRNMISSLEKDLDKKREISSGRFYSFNRQLDMLLKYKKAEAYVKKFMEKHPDFGREKSEEEKPKTLSPEIVRQIRRDILGLKD